METNPAILAQAKTQLQANEFYSMPISTNLFRNLIQRFERYVELDVDSNKGALTDDAKVVICLVDDRKNNSVQLTIRYDREYGKIPKDSQAVRFAHKLVELISKNGDVTSVDMESE